jgi:Xaa-Pro aminopeptidase
MIMRKRLVILLVTARRGIFALIGLVGLSSVIALAQAPATIPAAEFTARRDAVLARTPHDFLVALARPALADVRGQSFAQDPDFLYLTGLSDSVGAVLVLDGPAHQSWLFQPSTLGQFAESVYLKPRAAETLTRVSGLDHVVPTEQFVPFMQRRTAEEKAASIRLAKAGIAEWLTESVGTPAGLASVVGSRRQWRRALADALPGTKVIEDQVLSEIRLIKSPAEIDQLRRAGAASAAAFLAGLRTIATGRRQREAEAAVVGVCLTQGDGVSFWPWAMSGPAAVYPQPWGALRDPQHLDRLMEAGELVRLDVGCAYGGYMGDVGRTVPVSGRFSDAQRETWDLLVDAYRRGLATIRDGVRVSQVFAASMDEIRRQQPGLKTALARHAATTILSPNGAPHWQLHGVGLDVAEGPGLPADVLRSGMVFDYEPIFAVDGQGFYMEDMILVTETGYELLTPGLPYGAREVEVAMRSKRVK